MRLKNIRPGYSKKEPAAAVIVYGSFKGTDTYYNPTLVLKMI